MKITMFGTGYVGLVTGACFAEMGNDVVCVDINPDVVETLNNGEVPIFEPGLTDMVNTNASLGRLRFTTDAALGVRHGKIIFIAVGTPPGEDGSADMRYVHAVADTIGTHMQEAKIVVDKSTVPVGTADRVEKRIQAKLDSRHDSHEFSVVSNPEFLKEGAAVADFLKPDRIIIGSNNPEAAVQLEQLYAPFNRNHDKIIHMDVRSAELTKYAANVMLATRISLMNEFANLAEKLDADIESVRRGIGSDPRIGHHFIYAGTGYGGSCFPKDVKALVQTAQEAGIEPRIMEGVEAVNERQKTALVRKIRQHFDNDLQGKRFALWGLAFKPNTDDLREAASISIIESLLGLGAQIDAYDPVAYHKARSYFGERGGLNICERREDTLADVDALIVVTEWNEFRSPDYEGLKCALRERVIFDGRNLYDPTFIEEQGIAYYGIGRGR